MKLDGPGRKALREILLEAFDRLDLKRALAESSPSRELEDLVAPGPFSDQVFDLIKRAEKAGWLDEIQTLLEQEVPNRHDLIERTRAILEQARRRKETGASIDRHPVDAPYADRPPAESPHAGSTPGDRPRDDVSPRSSGKSPCLFYSYAHEDEALRDELAKHLKLLERQGVISSWHDRGISPGTGWDQEINQKLLDADIILLLVSVDFLASDYIRSKELKVALKRHEKGEARVIPIILRPTAWATAPFSHFQALPLDGRPVTSWANRDEAFVSIADAVREIAVDRTGDSQNRREDKDAPGPMRANRDEAGRWPDEETRPGSSDPISEEPTSRAKPLDGKPADEGPVPELEISDAVRDLARARKLKEIDRWRRRMEDFTFAEKVVIYKRRIELAHRHDRRRVAEGISDLRELYGKYRMTQEATEFLRESLDSVLDLDLQSADRAALTELKGKLGS